MTKLISSNNTHFSKKMNLKLRKTKREQRKEGRGRGKVVKMPPHRRQQKILRYL
jgi:hypothetical protein